MLFGLNFIAEGQLQSTRSVTLRTMNIHSSCWPRKSIVMDCNFTEYSAQLTLELKG